MPSKPAVEIAGVAARHDRLGLEMLTGLDGE